MSERKRTSETSGQTRGKKPRVTSRRSVKFALNITNERGKTVKRIGTPDVKKQCNIRQIQTMRAQLLQEENKIQRIRSQLSQAFPCFVRYSEVTNLTNLNGLLKNIKKNKSETTGCPRIPETLKQAKEIGVPFEFPENSGCKWILKTTLNGKTRAKKFFGSIPGKKKIQ